MVRSEQVFVGIDVGSSRTKAVVLDRDKTLLGFAVRKSGTDFAHSSDLCLKESMRMAKVSEKQISKIVSTGYGRRNITLPKETKTEISCTFNNYPISTLPAYDRRRQN